MSNIHSPFLVFYLTLGLDTIVMIFPETLTRDSYSPFGSLIAVDAALPWENANIGTAERYNRLGELLNHRPATATANLCVFRSQAFMKSEFQVTLLERHAYSTQLFIPMTAKARFLVIVAQGDTRPDLATLKAFIAKEGMGITYRPGIWHHPLIALDQVTDFACVVFEDASKEDCDVFSLNSSILINL